MKRLGEKLNKRLHSLLVPYLLWNTIYYVAYVAASRIPGVSPADVAVLMVFLEKHKGNA